MSKKFETLIKEQETALNEGIGSAIRWAQNNRTIRNFMNGSKQGSAEGDDAYRQRLMARGNIRESLKSFKRYDQGRIPIIFDFDKNYAQFLRTKVIEKANSYVHGKEGAQLIPTIAYMNDGINYNNEPTADGQKEFYNRCAANITLQNARDMKPNKANMPRYRYFMDSNIGGVLLQFAKDLEKAKDYISTKNSPVIYAEFVTPNMSKTPPSLIEQDKNIYNNNINILTTPIHNAIMHVIAEVKKMYAGVDPSMTGRLVKATLAESAGTADPGTGEPAPPPPPAPAPSSDLVKLDDRIREAVEANREASGYEYAIRTICEKILREAQKAPTVQEGLMIFDEALQTAFNETIGCEDYPEQQGNEVLLKFYYNKLPAAAEAAGVSGLSNDLYFVPEAELPKLQENAEKMLGNQAMAWGLDKIYNAIKHPIQTAQKFRNMVNKAAGQYGFDSMYTNIQSS